MSCKKDSCGCGHEKSEKLKGLGFFGSEEDSKEPKILMGEMALHPEKTKH